MFYTLVRTYMNLRKLQESIRERKDRTPDPRQQTLPKEPEIISVTFNKVKRSMGLSIVAAKVSEFFLNSLTHCLIVLSAENFCKQFGPRSGQTKHLA